MGTFNLLSEAQNDLQGGVLQVLAYIFGVVALVFGVFVIYLGFLLAKAEDEGKRREAKDRMVKMIVTLLIISVLTGMLFTINFLEGSTPIDPGPGNNINNGGNTPGGSPGGQVPGQPPPDGSPGAPIPPGGNATVIEIARRYAPAPGQWAMGATGPQRFDCSAFTQHVFREAGITIGRDTLAQHRGVTKITRDQLAPGDLIFWNLCPQTNSRHVEIFIGFYTGARTSDGEVWARIIGAASGGGWAPGTTGGGTLGNGIFEKVVQIYPQRRGITGSVCFGRARPDRPTQ